MYYSYTVQSSLPPLTIYKHSHATHYNLSSVTVRFFSQPEQIGESCGAVAAGVRYYHKQLGNDWFNNNVDVAAGECFSNQCCAFVPQIVALTTAFLLQDMISFVFNFLYACNDDMLKAILNLLVGVV